ncbi:hypothetical protein DFJ73DRAFT_768400 [Zopfochytrium polystomum]|nr:hypothetical protein DFJ73DRAFT_768400 [Zopfochytrium polystomum]
MKLGVNSQLSQLTAAEEPTYHTGTFLKFTSASLHRLDEMKEAVELIPGRLPLSAILTSFGAKLKDSHLIRILSKEGNNRSLLQLISNVEGTDDNWAPAAAAPFFLKKLKDANADDSTAAPSADSALAGSSMANTPSQIASSTGGSTGGASSSLDSGPSTPTASLAATAEARPKQAAAAAAEAAWKVAQTFKLPHLCIVSRLLQQKALECRKPHQLT